MMRTYQQLTYEQRCQISALKKSNSTQREIANILGVNQSTVSLDISKNTGGRGYPHKQAQEKSTQQRKSACKATKMTPRLIAIIEEKILIEWSPE